MQTRYTSTDEASGAMIPSLISSHTSAPQAMRLTIGGLMNCLKMALKRNTNKSRLGGLLWYFRPHFSAEEQLVVQINRLSTQASMAQAMQQHQQQQAMNNINNSLNKS